MDLEPPKRPSTIIAGIVVFVVLVALLYWVAVHFHLSTRGVCLQPEPNSECPSGL